ncbi:MAG: hypothetical protein EXS22_07825 [Pedosphaera sp.]|nr:hypothetical protein [Pedosphaera sp.]MSU43931.1 hypothetical protein [Pedosphaera sp.]
MRTTWIAAVMAMGVAAALQAQEQGERRERPKGLGATTGKGEGQKPAVQPTEGHGSKEAKGSNPKKKEKGSGEARKGLRKPSGSEGGSTTKSPVNPVSGGGKEGSGILESLGLTPEQKEKAHKIHHVYLQKRKEVLDNTKLSQEQKAEYLLKLRHDLRKEMKAILTEEQLAKLEAHLEKEGTTQEGRPSAGRPPESGGNPGQKPNGGQEGRPPESNSKPAKPEPLPKQLGLTEEQAKAFHELHHKWEIASATILKNTELSEEEKKARLYEAWKYYDTKVRELLTEEQYKKLQSLRAQAANLPGQSGNKPQPHPEKPEGGTGTKTHPETPTQPRPLPTPEAKAGGSVSSRVKIGLGA